MSSKATKTGGGEGGSTFEGVVVTPKKNGKWRVCVDYRPLNEATKRDHFPLPFQDEILNEVAGHEKYTVCDGYSGYFQIRIAEEDQKKTTFITPWGCYAFRKVEEGLQRLNGFGGQLNPDKCHIGEDEVILLGHKISQRGIDVDPAKAKALLELPSPKSIKEVISFMQKVKYMARFIHLASELLHLLQKLTQQVEFTWSEDLEEYFKSIKMVLSELPTLMPPCWDFPFFVNPSVGAESIGAILLQQDPQSSRMRPMYFTSRVTTNIEKGYSEAELMMLSLIFAMRKFRSYLLTKPFVILTSENLLPWVSSQMTMSPKISKWLMELQSYEYIFKVENSVRAQLAGILTYRLHEKVIKVPNVRPLPLPPPKVLSNTYTLFFDGAFRRATGKAGGGLVLVNPKGEVVMKEEVTLDGSTSNNETRYDVLISGLKICLAQKIQRLMVKGDALLFVKQILGIWACKNERLKTKVTSIRKLFGQFEEVQLYHIPRKENEDADLLAQQAVSSQDKAHVVIAAIALKDPQYAVIANGPFEKWGIDAMGSLPRTANGKLYILVAIDYMTRFGTPLEIVSDNGPGFRRGLLTEVCEELKISHRHSTPYYPQSNGLVEKAYRSIADIIRKMVESKPKHWDNFLDGAIWAYRTTYKDATQFTPFHLVYGQEALQPIELNIPTIKFTGRQQQNNDEAWIDRLLSLVKLEWKREAAYHCYERKALQLKDNLNEGLKDKEIKEKSLVLRYNNALDNRFDAKFERRWEGPFIVKKAFTGGYYQLMDLCCKEHPRKVNGYRLKPYLSRILPAIFETKQVSKKTKKVAAMNVHSIDFRHQHIHQHQEATWVRHKDSNKPMK
ncbi:hypothetical protein L7F22_028699 [Adiantum nelumboides]|nr:hypothetical protein [Adiantum nelumboides]